jgi:hypothetical protein
MKYCALLLCGFALHGDDKVKDPFGPTAPVEHAEAKVEAPRPSPRSLMLFGEPSLAQMKDAATRPAIRLVWIRTFHAPISIRAYMTAEGPRLRVARMSGKGGYEWGTIDFENDYALSKAHWERLTTLVNVDYARQPLRDVKPENREMLEGLDGASWILEVADSKGYTSEDVSNPATVSNLQEDEKRHIKSLGFHLEPFVAACKYLIQFAPMDADNIY